MVVRLSKTATGFWSQQMCPRTTPSIATVSMVSNWVYMIGEKLSLTSGDVKSASDWLHTFPGSKIGLTALVTYPKWVKIDSWIQWVICCNLPGRLICMRWPGWFLCTVSFWRLMLHMFHPEPPMVFCPTLSRWRIPWPSNEHPAFSSLVQCSFLAGLILPSQAMCCRWQLLWLS